MDVRIQKRLGHDFSLDIAFEGEACLGILGASGSGKSMTLKCIAGIETPDHGRIVVNGRTLFDSEKGINVRPQERRVGYLFQNYALFPRMTVRQNIEIGMRAAAAAKREMFAALIAQFHLQDLENRYPGQLSGGQQQRVALARMLAAEPEVLLLDEPFSALDTYLREQMQLQVLELVKRYPDVVMVTHSRDEAYKLCSRMVVLDGGRVLADGGTKELFTNPGHVRVARLTGCKNLSSVRKISEREIYATAWGLRLRTAENVGEDIRYVGIRAHDFVPAADPAGLDNVVHMGARRITEDPFEYIVVFNNGRAETAAEAGEMWWKYSKYMSMPETRTLRIPPESLLLLRGGDNG